MAGIAGALLCMWCRDGCSNQRVAAALTYFPPDPMYIIQPGKSEEKEEYSLIVHSAVSVQSYTHEKVTFVETPSGNRLAVIGFRKRNAKATILYSHGNATDLGAMYDRYADISDALGVNLVAYDYSGYGRSSGRPTERTTYEDISAVYEWTLRQYKDLPVILYGQSLGSGPSCYLASTQAVGGLILHSPIMSGLRVLTSNRFLACCDVYPNVDRISRVQCPVFVIHGKEDSEVGFDHGRTMHERVPFERQHNPWFVDGKGHNDIVESDTIDEYFARLRAFVDEVAVVEA